MKFGGGDGFCLMGSGGDWELKGRGLVCLANVGIKGGGFPVFNG